MYRSLGQLSVTVGGFVHPTKMQHRRERHKNRYHWNWTLFHWTDRLRDFIRNLWGLHVWNKCTTCNIQRFMNSIYSIKSYAQVSWGTEGSDLSVQRCAENCNKGIRHSNRKTEELIKITLQDNIQPLAMPQPCKQCISVETKLPPEEAGTLIEIQLKFSTEWGCSNRLRMS